MRFACLGSGSKGNATLVEEADTCLLIDCGFSAAELEKRLHHIGCEAKQLDAILITHEHTDHVRGAKALARRFGLDLWSSMGTAIAANLLDYPRLNVFDVHQGFCIGSLMIKPVIVPHDAKEACQFVFSNQQQQRLGLLTDLGSLTPYIMEQYRDCDALVLEANHDTDMLKLGPYPPSLKRRVAGAYGHLSNQQAGILLKQLNSKHLQHLVLAHISEQNNTEYKVKSMMASLEQRFASVVYASQNQGFGWLQIR